MFKLSIDYKTKVFMKSYISTFNLPLFYYDLLCNIPTINVAIIYNKFFFIPRYIYIQYLL